ncbi:MAG: pyridoxal 5'-phosphate synthase glutaminase subunit PdxT [Candidatus Bathyarchaeota archaeon]|nr:pyridoxal 5'-phosphate synthase glutaminase subunit PdxT [Candidatus Bathyarchaeota archaeon]
MTKVLIGVLGIQGAVSEHVEIMEKVFKKYGIDGSVFIVKKVDEVVNLDGLIIPGGESTTIGRIAEKTGLVSKIVEKAKNGTPVFGTCAGLILLAKEVYDAKIGSVSQPTFGLMDIRVVRNAFGRQKESFEADLNVPVLGEKLFHAVFIRAPIVEKVWGNVEVLAKYEEKIVAVQDRNLLATAFHPELADDLRFHKYFLDLTLKFKN